MTGRIRPEERTVAAGAFLTLFGFTTGHGLLETARDALFLGRLSAARLPWVYLAIAVLALLVAEYQTRLLRRLSSRNELSGWLVFAGLVTGALWVALRVPSTWTVYALYVWTGVLATLVVVRFWTQLSGLFTVTQAKRIYALVGSGSVLGAILGSGLARLLTAWFTPPTLVLAAAVVFILASPAPRLLDHRRLGHLPRTRGVASARQLTRMARLIWGRPYLRRVASLVLASTITLTLIDFVFKTAVDRSVPPEQLAPFFATVYLALNSLSLLVQILGVSWLIRRLGVNRAIAIVPGLLVIGSLGVSFGGTLAFALLLKGLDGSLRHSLFRTGSELFWVPIPIELRVRAKPLIDTLGQRGGQAIASLLILLLLGATTREAPFAALAGITATAWFFLAIDLRRHYLDVFRESLDSEIREVRFDPSAVDAETCDTLIAALADDDERRVSTALELLVALERTSAVPTSLLEHRSPEVVRRALGVLAGEDRPDVAARLPPLLQHPDAGVRAAALGACARVGSAEAVDRAVADPAPEVRAVAAIARAAGAGGEGESDVSVAEALAGVPEARLALAVAIGRRGCRQFEHTLLALVFDPDDRVRNAAIAALGTREAASRAPELVPLLADRAVRAQVRATLVRMGTRATAALCRALADPAVPHAVRRQIPESLAAYGAPLAAQLLTDRLLEEPDGMIRFKILRALGRMRRVNPGLSLDLGALRSAQVRTEQTALQLMDWRHVLERPSGSPSLPDSTERTLLLGLLRDKQRHALERLFRLMNLEAANQDFFRVFQGLESGRPHAIASSCELLEHLVPARRRPGLYRLVYDLYDTDRADEGPVGGGARLTVAEALLELSHSDGESVARLATAVRASWSAGQR